MPFYGKWSIVQAVMTNYAMSESAARLNWVDDGDECFIYDLHKIVLGRLAFYLGKSQKNAHRYSAFAPNGQHVAAAEPVIFNWVGAICRGGISDFRFTFQRRNCVREFKDCRQQPCN